MLASNKIILTALLSGYCGVLQAGAQTVFFEDNFDAGISGGSWDTYQSGGDSLSDFNFDYSSLGIPSAPNSTGGTTIGTRFLVNQASNVFQGISASPRDQHFSGDFTIRFDMWINFIGPAPDGGSGSTQMATFGWGTTGTRVQWAGSNHSVVLSGSADGGTGSDYRVYLAAGGAPMSPTTGVYSAGISTAPDSRNNTDPYYSPLGNKTIPAAQTALFGSQTGTTAAGTLGMAWRDVIIEKSGNVINWSVDGLRIASVPIEGVTLGGDNLFLGMFDINATSSIDPNTYLNTAIFDNIRVIAIPEPATFSLLAIATVPALLMRRRRR